MSTWADVTRALLGSWPGTVAAWAPDKNRRALLDELVSVDHVEELTR